MASTALVPVRKHDKRVPESETSAPSPKRSEEARAKLAETDAILDEIETILEVDPPKPQTLADLIRWGATMNKQAIGSWTGEQGETCALQAAFTAAKAGGLL